MRLRKIIHDSVVVGGQALRAVGGDIDAFLCWTHIPSLRAKGRRVPEQFTHATYVCDLEVINDGLLVVHKERNFATAAQARAWFRFVAWCLAKLEPEDFDFPNPVWGLT